MGRIGVQKEPSTCLFRIKFPYIERKWDKEEGKKAETWAGRDSETEKREKSSEMKCRGQKRNVWSQEERRRSWPAEGGRGVGSGRPRFPCCFKQGGKMGSVPGQVLPLWPVPPGGTGLCCQSRSRRPDLGLTVPALRSADTADVLTSADAASAALGSLWIKATCRTCLPPGEHPTLSPPTSELRTRKEQLIRFF